jgi:hypothetical protein
MQDSQVISPRTHPIPQQFSLIHNKLCAKWPHNLPDLHNRFRRTPSRPRVRSATLGSVVEPLRRAVAFPEGDAHQSLGSRSAPWVQILWQKPQYLVEKSLIDPHALDRKANIFYARGMCPVQAPSPFRLAIGQNCTLIAARDPLGPCRHAPAMPVPASSLSMPGGQWVELVGGLKETGIMVFIGGEERKDGPRQRHERERLSRTGPWF